jgi:hypothetical protein
VLALLVTAGLLLVLAVVLAAAPVALAEEDGAAVSHTSGTDTGTSAGSESG